MTQSIVRSMVTALALSGNLLAASVVTTAAAATPEKTAIPQTSEGIWQAVDAKAVELKTTIDAGALANVHHQAYAIRDLVAALPTHSTGLTADQLSKVQADARFVATLAERLDAAGDAKDVAATKASYDKLTMVLAALRARYRPAK